VEEMFKIGRNSQDDKNTEKKDLVILRHLKDINDLRNSRDSGIEEGQEELISSISERIVSSIKAHNIKILILTISTKKRVVESTNLIVDSIRNQNPEIKVVVSEEENLIDLDHGDFVLPTDYRVGDYFQPFEVAWKAFLVEAFDNDNPDYQFGDSVVDDNGISKYPDLEKVFTRFGESQIDINLRLYKSIVNGHRNKEKIIRPHILNIIVTHSLPYAILKQLVDVAYKIKNEDVCFETGELFKECWGMYKEDNNKYDFGFGDLSEIDIGLLQEKKFIDILLNEISFLESKYEKKV